MGRYLNQDVKGEPLPATGKVEAIIKRIPGTIVRAHPPHDESEWTPDLVCVVENGFFDAAGYAHSPEEMMAFSLPHDRRHKTWLHVPNADKLADP
jgi:hypothetical protein